MADKTYATPAPRDNSGRYAHKHMCDACGKSVNYPDDSYTDYDVCDSSDGPGFMLCARKRCMTKRDALPVEARRALYTERRALNETVEAARETEYHKDFLP